MSLKVYEYKSCDTCRKALKYLEARKARFESVPIVESPPSAAELRRMLGFLKARGGSLKNLFNTSGQLYRELGVAEKLASGMTESEAIALLAKNGKLIKRPFAISARDGRVGFKPEDWAELLEG
jgi:arsenate reductase